MITEKEIFPIICSYAIGCCTTGYYLTRWRTGSDIRRLGSGSVGASNVGRTLGVSGFVITFLFDFTKGALVVLAANFVQMNPTVVVSCMVAVVAGHIWPAQLRFLGGKGIAVSLGALCIYNYEIGLTLLCLFVPSYLISRRFILSGMLAYALTPAFIPLIGLKHIDFAAAGSLAVLVLFAHRRNIRDDICTLIRPSPMEGLKGKRQ